MMDPKLRELRLGSALITVFLGPGRAPGGDLDRDVQLGPDGGLDRDVQPRPAGARRWCGSSSTAWPRAGREHALGSRPPHRPRPTDLRYHDASDP
jgi:hypothetical protein